MEKVKVIAKHTLATDSGMVKEGDELFYHPVDAAMLVKAGAVEYADKKDAKDAPAKEKKEMVQTVETKEKKSLSDNPGATITIKENKKK